MDSFLIKVTLNHGHLYSMDTRENTDTSITRTPGWLTQSHEKKCLNQRLDVLRFEPVPLFSAKSGNKKNRNGNEASRLSFKTRKPCYLTP